MKNIYLCLTILVFFYSCSSDSDLSAPTIHSNFLAKESSNEGSSDGCANSNNPYDFAGRLHNEVFGAYYATSNLPVTLSGIINHVETTANANTAFYGMEGALYHALSPERIAYLLNNPFTSRTEVINNSALSSKAKSSINVFIDQVLLICAGDASYTVIYNYVTAYESTILADTMLSVDDKKVILTTTSILRYAASRRKRPKKNTDLDWEMNVTHIVGSIEGSSYGTSEAITEALSLGVANHQ